jgi:transcriptional regulator with XRE-family HTH domain
MLTNVFGNAAPINPSVLRSSAHISTPFRFGTDNRNLSIKQNVTHLAHNLFMGDPVKTLAERLRETREAKGWRKVDLQRAAKIHSPSTLTDLESGKAIHSPQLPAIAEALGVDVMWLKTGKTQAIKVIATVATDPATTEDMVELAKALQALPIRKRLALLVKIYDEIDKMTTD